MGFPNKIYAARAPRWWRTHHKDYSPWWFSSSKGRFDLADPRGTLNTANSKETAVREALGELLVGSRHVAENSVINRVVTCLEIPALKIADLTNPNVAIYGIAPGDVSGPQNDAYRTTQQWANFLDHNGFDGILSRSRFSGGNESKCLYWFSEAGGRTGNPPGCGTLDRLSVKDVVESMGYVIDSIPDSSELWIVE